MGGTIEEEVTLEKSWSTGRIHSMRRMSFMPQAVRTGALTSSQAVPVVREFTDREEPRQRFWDKYNAMEDGSWEILAFYGAGGIGKTELLERLMKEMDVKSKAQMGTGYRYVRCDFNDRSIQIRDIVAVLNLMKKQLEREGIDFPLYEIGAFYSAVLKGDKAEMPEQKTFFDKNPALSKIKKALNALDGKEDMFSNGMNTAISLLDIGGATAHAMAGTVPVMSFLKSAFGVAEKVTEYVTAKCKTLDSEHEIIHREMQERLEDEKHPERIYEYLPTLFARDINDWVNEHHAKLVIFLDGYERFGVEEWDLWLRSGNENSLGMINYIPNVLWVIAGRDKLQWDGVPGGELENPENQRELTPLSYEDANDFLSKAGIASQELRDGICKLTGGWPLYLSGCVDVYAERGDKTTLSDFGKTREKIFEKIVDGRGSETKELIRILCALKTWTDEMAYEVLKPNLNHTVYEELKKLSFLRSQQIQEDDFVLTVFTFDRTVHEILFTQYKQENTSKYLYKDIREKVCHYFSSKMNGVRPESRAFSYYLENMAECIVRLTDSADELVSQYEEYLDKTLNDIRGEGFGAKADIVSLFFERVGIIGITESVPYAFFENKVGNLKTEFGEYAKAHEYLSGSYKKFVSLLGEEHPYSLQALQDYSSSTDGMGHYKEAINLQEKYLNLCRKVYGKGDERTLSFMRELAYRFRFSNKPEKALELDQEIFALMRERFGEEDDKTLDAMYNMAYTLNICMKREKDADQIYKQAITIWQKKIDDYVRNIDSLEETEILHIPEMVKNIEELLWEMSTADNEQIVLLPLKRTVVIVYKKVFGETDERTIKAMGYLADTLLKQSKRSEEKELREEFSSVASDVLRFLQTIFAEDKNRCLLLMDSMTKEVAWVKGDTEEGQAFFELMFSSKKYLANVVKQNLGESDEKTLQALEEIADWLRISYRLEEEELDIRKEILDIRCKTLGCANEKTIEAMDNVADVLQNMERYEEEMDIRKEVLTILEKNCSETDGRLLYAMERVAERMNDLEQYESEMEVRNKILSLYRKTTEKDVGALIVAIKDFAILLHNQGKYTEELPLREELIPLIQEKFGEDSDETIEALIYLADVSVTLQQYERALHLWAQIVDYYTKHHDDEEESYTFAAKCGMIYVLCCDGKYQDALFIAKDICASWRAWKERGAEGAESWTEEMVLFVLSICGILDMLDRYSEPWKIGMNLRMMKEFEKTQERDPDYYSALLWHYNRRQMGDFISILRELYDTLLNNSHPEDAKKCLAQALELSKVVYGENDKRTVELASVYANA